MKVWKRKGAVASCRATVACYPRWAIVDITRCKHTMSQELYTPNLFLYLQQIGPNSVTSAPTVAERTNETDSPIKGDMQRAKSAPRPHTPLFMMMAVPLPGVKSSSLTKEPSSLTIEDLPAIRSKVQWSHDYHMTCIVITWLPHDLHVTLPDMIL